MKRTASALVAAAAVLFGLPLNACDTTRSVTAPTGAHREPPTVTGISPVSGPTAGGSLVTIRGSGFVHVLTVRFGAVAAQHYVVASDTEIRALSPPQAASLQPVVVRTSAGPSTPLLRVDPFLYVAPVPRIGSISPSAGPPSGGTTVTISGSGFTAATTVSFGSIHAVDFSVVSDRLIKVVAPAQASGLYAIVVTTAGGTSSSRRGDIYSYRNPPPEVEALEPGLGPTAGGTSVTIGGSGFASATGVSFGSDPALHFTIVSNTEITAVSPPENPGARYVRVTSMSGTSKPGGPPDQFTFRR